jgi:hypothetical protein
LNSAVPTSPALCPGAGQHRDWEDNVVMSIKLLALELYRAQQKVYQLEAQLAEAPFNQQDAIGWQLREAKEELRLLRNMMEGAKSPSPYRTHIPRR